MKISLISLLLAAFLMVPAWVQAEDAAPASTATDTATTTAPAPAALTAPAAEEADAGEAAVEALDFASGEIVAFDAASGKLDVKVYLDAEGNASEQTLSVTVDAQTEITSGDEPLKTDALTKGAEVDVEYDTSSKKATYIFIY